MGETLPSEICRVPHGRSAEGTREPRPMTRQKSERGVVPKGRRKTVPTEVAQPRGGKAAPVEQRSPQLRLWDETAEDRSAPEAPRAADEAEARPCSPATLAAPKSSHTEEPAAAATMAAVIARLDQASDILTPPIATACFPDDWTVRALSIRGNPFRLFGWVADGKYRGILPRRALRGPPWPSAIAGHASKLAQTSPPLPRAPRHDWRGAAIT